MRRLRDALPCWSIAVVLAGCAETSPLSQSPTSPSVEAPAVAIRGYAPAVAGNADEMARLLASGLQDPAARFALLTALQQSPLAEHKVILAEFLQTAEGRGVLDAIARLEGVAPGAVVALAAQLPTIDLYVPYVEHRRTWRASQPIAVLALVDETSDLVAWGPAARRIVVNRRAAAPGTPMAVLVLGPHKAQLDRAAVPTATHADVIEPNGVTIQAKCTEETCDGGGGGNPPPSNRLWLDVFTTFGVCDNLCWESNEFEFKGFNSYGVENTPRVRCEGVGSSQTIDPQTFAGCAGWSIVHETSPSEVAWIDVYVQETDGWLNGDDQFREAGFSNFPTAPRVVENGNGFRSAHMWHANGPNWECTNLSDEGYPLCQVQVTMTLRWP